MSVPLFQSLDDGDSYEADQEEERRYRAEHPLTLAAFSRSVVVADAAIRPRRLSVFERPRKPGKR